MSPLAKLVWLRHEQPALFARAARFAGIKSYVLFRLFGVRARAVPLPRRGSRRLHWRMALREAAALPYDAVAGVAARFRSRV